MHADVLLLEGDNPAFVYPQNSGRTQSKMLSYIPSLSLLPLRRTLALAPPAATRRYLVADVPEAGMQAQAGMVAGGFTGMLLGLAPGSSMLAVWHFRQPLPTHDLSTPTLRVTFLFTTLCTRHAHGDLLRWPGTRARVCMHVLLSRVHIAAPSYCCLALHLNILSSRLNLPQAITRL